MRELHHRAGELLDALTREIDSADETLLDCVPLTDDLIHQAERMRALLLRHARRRGASWSAMAEATGTPVTTLRDRLARSDPIPEGTIR